MSILARTESYHYRSSPYQSIIIGYSEGIGEREDGILDAEVCVGDDALAEMEFPLGGKVEDALDGIRSDDRLLVKMNNPILVA